MAKLNIQNESGDKEFFTIIPNYIANHSTANDQALYFQMKRYAGEDGKCFATEKTLMSKLGIGKKAYDKSVNYLTSKGWVEFIGLTGGRTRPIKTYRINNIWDMNNDYFKKISAESILSSKEKISAESEGDKSQKQHKISAESNVEEEPIKEEPLIISTATQKSVAGKEVNEIIHLFKNVNPSIGKYYNDRTQRAAVERMLKEYGRRHLEDMIRALPKVNAKKYWPKSTTPYQLESNLGIYKAKNDEERAENKTAFII